MRATPTFCLNGWWDFVPVFADPPEAAVPGDGWLPGKYLVPSYWNKPQFGVRRKGEHLFRPAPAAERTIDPELLDDPEIEFLFDAWDYPREWSKTRSGWVRRSLALKTVEPDRRYWLRFDAVAPRFRLLVNRREAGQHGDPLLPAEFDVTELLAEGDNEIAVLIEDHRRDERGRTLVPSGNMLTHLLSGIWQDVWLVQRGEVFVREVAIRTSTRQKRIEADLTVANASGRPRTVVLRPHISAWKRSGAAAAAKALLAFDRATVTLDPGATGTVTLARNWADAAWWSPEKPHLYWLVTRVEEDGHVLDTHEERFGFREVWLDGPDLMLNDHPIHLFSDWGHKVTPYHWTEAWIRQWFSMLRAGHLNHSRLHTHPHPRLYLDLADEEGILLTGETGIHGSGGAQAGDSPEFWQAAREHVRRFVRRDRNHPSLILWSIENEMRWNGDQTGLGREELPKLRQLFGELDPTRPAYHEGDSSLWDESCQAIISRHYGKECAGLAGWDRRQPFHAGEIGLYHYAGPNNTCHLGGDAVWADYRQLDEMAGRDAALIIEAGRTVGVSCFGPWNQSCLENRRPETERVALSYADWAAPGVKPLVVNPHTSEFTFWKKGKGHTPFESFSLQAAACRPLAVIDRSWKSAYFSDAPIRRELFVCNDTAEAVTGVLRAALKLAGRVVHETEWTVDVPRGRVVARTFEGPAGGLGKPGRYQYEVSLRVGKKVRDRWKRRWQIASRQVKDSAIAEKVLVFGPGSLREGLAAIGVTAEYVSSLELPALGASKILLLEKDAVVAGSQQNRQLQRFVQLGGRVLVLEQRISPFPSLPLEDKPVLGAFRRAYRHPVLRGLADADFFAWGEDPYPLPDSDAVVARQQYRKDGAKYTLFLLDSGEGGFGTGNLEYSPLFEAADGHGLILACQLRITEKLADTPAVRAVLVNLLRRMATYRVGPTPRIVVIDDAQATVAHDAVQQAQTGATVLVTITKPEHLKHWGYLLNLELKVRDTGEVYQAVRAADDPLLSGVSNDDTSGIETWSYTGPDAKNRRIGELFLEPVKGMDTLLVTPTKSCLRELFVEGGRSEPLRAHTISRALSEGKVMPAVALGRVRVGKGQVLLVQINLQLNERLRLTRFRHRLLANLGVRFPGSLLDGPGVPGPADEGP